MHGPPERVRARAAAPHRPKWPQQRRPAASGAGAAGRPAAPAKRADAFASELLAPYSSGTSAGRFFADHSFHCHLVSISEL
mmetsp:Transcript_95213/g.302120  ORF Transcript_95213/g.302120 Transcript_95213/m.302120 type:complete len:81 (-) Transcript_95213:544-786(-)